MEKLTLEQVVKNVKILGYLDPDSEKWLKKQPYGEQLAFVTMGAYYVNERLNFVRDQLIKNIYFSECLLMASDIKDTIKDLTPLEKLPINRLEVFEPNEQKINLVFSDYVELLNPFLTICSYDCLLKALYAETELEPLKALMLDVNTSTKVRALSYSEMYQSSEVKIYGPLENLLQLQSMTIEDLKKRFKMPFVNWNYKGYLVTNKLIEATRKDGLKCSSLGIPLQYIEHVKKRYTKDSERYKYRYELMQWPEYCERG